MWLSLHVELIYVEWPMKGGPCKYKVINSAVLFELKKKKTVKDYMIIALKRLT